MPFVCPNCGTEILDKYCPHCGQKRDVSKLTWRSLLQEIVHFFSHIEHGFLNTSIQLLIRPAKVIREYLNGKRIKYQKPISLYLIWVGIHLLAFRSVNTLMNYENLRSGNVLLAGGETGAYIVQHTSMFGFLMLPVMTLFAWLILSQPKMNYIETVVLVIYLLAAFEILIFFQIVITGLLFQANFRTDGFSIQIQVINFVWSFFCLLSFFKKEKIKLLILRILLVQILAIVTYQKLSAIIAGLILNSKN
jgi:hypothetical protein